MKTYGERAELTKNSAAKKLFKLMEEKQTNLTFNPDVTTKNAFLKLVDQVGSEIALLKTHIDIIDDFDWDLIEKLQALAEKHHFMIFEDRKFADIGNTVVHQYQSGIYKIATWADITNAHILPGPGIIEGLKQVGMSKNRGLLLLAEMSSKGNLLSKGYTQKAIDLAEIYSDFVIGFIAMGKITNDPRFLHLTPGVKKEVSSDSLGQQYQTPKYVIGKRRSDMIIVGRGIYKASDPHKEAKIYRKQAWEAYLARL